MGGRHAHVGTKVKVDAYSVTSVRRHALFHLSSFCCDHRETIRGGNQAAGGQGASIPSRGRLFCSIDFVVYTPMYSHPGVRIHEYQSVIICSIHRPSPVISIHLSVLQTPTQNHQSILVRNPICRILELIIQHCPHVLMTSPNQTQHIITSYSLIFIQNKSVP
jgi:hypothetical protein